jgi:cytoskeletal protein CcmA (bactofilin family)
MKCLNRNFIVGIILTILFLSIIIPGASARETVTGGTIIIGEGEITDGFVAMGGDVIIKGTVNGDVSAFAGNVKMTGMIDGDLSTFAGNTVIDGKITGDAEAFGGNVVVGEDAEIDGSFKAASGNVDINGAIEGDAEISSGSIILGPNAEIKGKLEYTARNYNKNSNAQIGSVTRRSETQFAAGGMPKVGRLLGGIFKVYWFLLTLVFGAILLIVAPKFSSEISDGVVEEPLKMALIGFLILIGVPVLLIILMITIVGIPFAIVGGFLFVLLVWIAGIYGKFAVGTWILSKVEKSNKWAALIIGLLVGVILGYIPFIGGLIGFGISILGLGAFTYMLKVRIRGNNKAALKNV